MGDRWHCCLLQEGAGNAWPWRVHCPRRVSMVSGEPDLLGWFGCGRMAADRPVYQLPVGNLSARAHGGCASKGGLVK